MASLAPGLAPEAETELAWALVEAVTYDRRKADDVCAELATRLAPLTGWRVSVDDARHRMVAWWLDGGAVARLRAGAGRDDPRPRLTPFEAAYFLACMLDPAKREAGARDAWRLLVNAGMEPYEAAGALTVWRPRDRVLPTGQWFTDEDLRAAAPDAAREVVLPSGSVVTGDFAEEVRELVFRGRKIDAIKMLRAAFPGMWLGDAKRDVETLAEQPGYGIRAAPDEPFAPALTGGTSTPARRALDRAVDALIMARPLHWVVLAAARVVEDPTVATMAVGLTERQELVLFYNPGFVLGLAQEHCMGVLVHEVNHVIFGHLVLPVDAVEHAKAWTLACECTANEFVPYPLPGAPFTLATLGLAPMETTAKRFEVLRLRGDLPEVECQGVLHHRLVSDPTHHADHENLPPQSAWRLLAEAAEVVGREIDPDTLRAVRAGTTAGLWYEALDPEGVGDLPWYELLRHLARGLAVRYATRRYPSRRAPDRVGIVPGRRTRREAPVVLAAIDTSGSMTTDELRTVAEELRGLTRQRVRVACVQCDTRICWEGWLAQDTTIQQAKGRGGTDLRPPFAPAVLARYRPDLIVYFTDGEGVAPESAPAGVDVLWLLTGASPRVPARFGRVACMRPRNQRGRLRTA